MASAEQCQRPRKSRNAIGIQLDLQPLPIFGCVAEHFTEVAQQSEAGDVGGGMELPRKLLFQSDQLLHQGVLTDLHLGEGGVKIRRCGGSCHGRREKHAGTERAAKQQLIASLKSALGPKAVAGRALNAQHQLQAKAAGVRGWVAVLKGVPTDEHGLLGIER